MQSQRRRFFPSCFDEIKDFEDGRKALLLATIPLVEERDDDEEHPRVWQGRKVSKTPIIIYMCVYVCVRESPTPLKGEEKVTKREDIFIQILIVCGEENQHLSARERTKKNAAQTSDASLEQYRSFRAVFTGNASVVEETCALTFCLFFNTKSMQGEKIFLYSEFGGVLLYTLQRKEEMRKKNPHPQRAVNAKTVVVASDREEREEREKREEERERCCV